ncbi:ATP-binding region ATPase domain protein [Paenibacillus curdlanolyticus YK9]|uniref:ATP-binding region ATPase domain protein n=1 Tax=Paenibacillus curdlanolyticus YK9 TaxID=717606 RepID=E0IGG8_9BACL|nr:ATP-binding protein [Paenibacillus curdlanolyticus]EFM08468.1 ATP-binding region ATPase domain protein [Paenibacillus curdlanolyticus YK9]
MYERACSEAEIHDENNNCLNKPLAFEHQIGYPLCELQPRDFERLVFCLYHAEIQNQRTDAYDEIQLMQGVGERGRDCLLLRAGKTVGLIQCKRYKTNIDVSEIGKEIVKFVLHALLDPALLPDVNDFSYKVAVSYGFSENALKLMTSLTNQSYDKNVIQGWAVEVIAKNKGLATIVWDDVKSSVFDTLDKMSFETIYPDTLNPLIESNSQIKSMFFELKAVLDEKSFKELLVEREKAALKFYDAGLLERRLKEKNEALFHKLQETKQEADRLFNAYSANFILYSFHNKEHSVSVSELLGDKVLDQGVLDALNEAELYVLASAAYLHDIGVCRTNEDIEQRFKAYEDSGQNHANKTVEEYAREHHAFFTYDFISDHWEALKLDRSWKEAIALVAGEKKDCDVYAFDYFDYAPAGGRTKVCIPYLHTLLSIADRLDVANLNANYLLQHYQGMEEHKESKKLWEEMTYGISSRIVDEDRIVFEGNCDNQLIYISLNRHIQETKHQLEQLIAKVRKYKPQYKFSIHFIEEKIDTPFSQKWGFSIDYNGIAETFMGKNIYEDKYDAIREAIQNAIDACQLRKAKEPTYVPEIEVRLTDKDIVIIDNGRGMDEYIVQNYFSKLCKSYYKDFEIDSIGQFGIGVFSYFMLCDSFSVETKTREGQRLCFKGNKNLYSYFYFYDEGKLNIAEGTALTLHLKEEVLREINVETLVTKVRDRFRFVDIPIKVVSEDTSTVMTRDSFSLDLEAELMYEVDYINRDKIKDLLLLESHINNERFEGTCGIIVERSDNALGYKPFNFTRTLHTVSSSYEGKVLICQKGVKVIERQYKYLRRASKLLDQLICSINIKQNLKINIGRNEFIDDQLDAIIAEFESDLLHKFFGSIHQFDNKESYEVCSEFVDYYLEPYLFPNKRLEDFTYNHFYIKAYIGKSEAYMLLNDFITEHPSFIFIGGASKFNKRAIRVAIRTGIPVMFIENDGLCRFYYQYFEEMNYAFSIYGHLNDLLMITKTEEAHEKYPIHYGMGISINNQLLFEVVSNIYFARAYYNTNHPLIQFYVTNRNKIKDNDKLFDKFHRFFKFLSNLYGSVTTTISLHQVNELLAEILSSFNVSIQLTAEDFPERFRGNLLVD